MLRLQLAVSGKVRPRPSSSFFSIQMFKKIARSAQDGFKEMVSGDRARYKGGGLNLDLTCTLSLTVAARLATFPSGLPLRLFPSPFSFPCCVRL